MSESSSAEGVSFLDLPAIERLYDGELTTLFGTWRHLGYSDGKNNIDVILHGDIDSDDAILCRVHSECVSAHRLLSTGCDCHAQMAMAQALIVERGSGIIIVLSEHEGRGFGHQALIEAATYAESHGVSQAEAYQQLYGKADNRDYGPAAAVLADLSVGTVDLISDNPIKSYQLARYGLRINARLSMAALDEQWGQYRADRAHLTPDKTGGAVYEP